MAARGKRERSDARRPWIGTMIPGSTEGAQYGSQGQAPAKRRASPWIGTMIPGSTEGAQYGSQGQALAKRRASPLDTHDDSREH